MPIRTAALLVAVVALSGCDSNAAVSPGQAGTAEPVQVVGNVATGLAVPWGLTFLPGEPGTAGGSALVSERDTGRILRVGESSVSTVGTMEGVAPRGEGGLLGIALADNRIYAYFTSAADNRVVRMAWDGRRLGNPEPILTGIPKAAIHNGGRIAFGPDGMLYVATGDAGNPESAQDRDSLAGKILRIAPDGSVPSDNPFPGSPVYSLGHRNVQGLAFDARNRLWATEFGQSDVDEVNAITAGSNYGWPECEGACGRDSYVDPAAQWHPTSIASPSGLAIVGDDAYVASLRGEALWRVPLDGSGDATRLSVGDLGRLRTIAVAPDGSLWLSTSNTDGRGDARAGDDRIVRLQIG